MPCALLCAVLAAPAGCSDAGGTAPEGQCALTAEFRGRSYSGMSVEVAPPEGEPLGTAVVPPCNDTNGADEAAEEIEVARLPGASPSRALVWHGRRDVVLLRDALGPVPRAVTRLFRAPDCAAGDAPIHLRGDWFGILGADGDTETDLVPPYDVTLGVTESSPARYERAELTVRVPASLGRPLTRDDTAVLSEGGEIEIDAGCNGRRFVALRVAAHPEG